MIKNTPEDDIESYRKSSTELKSKEIQDIHKDINTNNFDEENDIMENDDENIEDLKSCILNSNTNEEI